MSPVAQVVQGSVGDTRTEADYLAHVRDLIATDPNAIKWHLVMDCLNTHQSESLVQLKPKVLILTWGVKGESGILSVETRSAFCVTPAISVFHFTPNILPGSADRDLVQHFA